MGIYIVVLKARASAIFYPGEAFSMNYVRVGHDPFQLTFRTTYEEAGFEAPLPKDLWVEARGPARDLHAAAELFGNAALEVSAIIAFAANASMGALEMELAFDASPQSHEHEFLQSFVEDRPVTTVPGRRIDVEVVKELIQALATHPERTRIQRAIVQYVEALQSWRPGRQITCLAHLYMGVEAVTKAVLREYLRKSGQTDQDAAAVWNVERKQIESEVRRRLVFQGDADCYRKAKEVSDAFEHGYSDFDEIRKPAHEVIVRTAGHLRRAIIEALSMDVPLRESALADAPRGPLVVVRYIYGTLLGNAEQLAAKGQHYPLMEWRPTLKNVLIGKDGKYHFQPEDKLTAKIGEGVKFREGRFEAWDGSSIHDEPDVKADPPIEAPAAGPGS